MPRVLIVAHGQPGNPGPQQEAVEELARAVAPHLPEAEVIGATLAMPGALEAADGCTLVYPMFMAEGWFTRSELPRRLALAGASGAQVLSPFGCDPGLPALCLGLLARAASRRDWALGETQVLLAAHGSGRSRAPAKAARQMADALSAYVAGIRCGFIEEDPRLVDAAADLPTQSLCLPLFATCAEHVTDDLPRALSRARFAGVTLDPVGLAPEVPAMIAKSIGVVI